MSKRRVVITGLGAVTPIGIGVEAFWKGVLEEKTGFAPISRFDTTGYKCRLAAEVKDFQPEQYMDRKTARRMELFSQYAVAAAGEAIADARLVMEEEDPYRVGCSIGSGVGSLQAMERECGAVFALPRYATDNALGVAILAHRALERGVKG